MSDVIRDALIRIRYEVQKSKLEGPEISQTIKAHEEVAKATQETSRAYGEATESARAYTDESIFRMQGMRSTTEKAAQSHEDFGRRSFASMAHAGHGVLQLSRGIALMAASGEEDSRKLLEGLMKIEAGVSIAKGAANLARFAGEFGPAGAAVAGLGTVVAAGAAGMHIYSGEVERVKRSLDSATESAHKQRDALTLLSAKTEAIANEGRAAKTDAAVGDIDKRAAREVELRYIRQSRSELESNIAISEAVRRRAADEESIAASGAKAETLKPPAEQFNQWLAAKTFGGAFGSETPSTHYARTGAEAHAKEQAARKYQTSAAERELAGEQREKELIEAQRDQDIEQRRELEQIQIAEVQRRLHPTDPRKKAELEMEVWRYDDRQRRLAAQADATGKIPAGFEAGRSFEESQTGPIHQSAAMDIQRATRDSGAAITAIADIITNLKTQLETMRSGLDSAHPN